eukprot:TRINITY_DN1603_c0_g1_i1.p1 TRINITY_DN1603_c0_g1~~TRINITY_DN1603_c0_g1_i1.p1  ORF type:complete len:2158 (+),score=703.02 TRINITY_DN1603_c0_g1_i1:70-6543(+)
MDLVKALEVVSTAPIDTNNEEQRKIKTTACRVVIDQICTPLLRNSSDFPRYLSVATAGLVRLCGDEDINVRTVSGECLNRVVLELIDSFPERILFELYKVVKRGRSSGRSQKTALLKFSEVCRYIKPSKCPKYIMSLLVPFADIIAEGDETLQEALAASMDKICATLLDYLKEKEINYLLELFMKNINHETAPIRRAAATSIVAICQHAPVSPFDFVVLTLAKPFGIDPQGGGDVTIDSVNATYLLGSLNCFLQLTKCSWEILRTREYVSPNPIRPYIPLFGKLFLECVQHEDHNVEGASLELLSQILSTYGKHAVTWGGLESAHIQMRAYMAKLWPLLEGEGVRTANRAVALTCFASIAQYYSPVVLEFFNQRNLSILESILPFRENSDPLIRGTAGNFMGCLIIGVLKCVKANQYPFGKDFQVEIPRIFSDLFSMLKDPSSVAVKGVCRILGKCLKALTVLHSVATYRENGKWALLILKRLMASITDNTYWLVKVETIAAISKANFRVIHCSLLPAVSETAVSQDSQENSQSSQREDSGMRIEPEMLGEQVVSFVISQFGDGDVRVRVAAAQGLVSLIPRLWLPLPLHPPHLHSITKIRETIPQTIEQRVIQANLSHVVKLLLQTIGKPHMVNHAKGSYYALLLLAQKYNSEKRFKKLQLENVNLMSAYLGDVLPLAFDSLNCSSWLATDLDTHIQIVQLMGSLSKNAGHVFNKYSASCLQHTLQLLSVMTQIVQNKPLPTLKERSDLPNALTGADRLGYFASDSVFLKLFERLAAARNFMAAQQANTVDKFTQFRTATLETLAVIIHNIGRDIGVHAEEILSYLSVHLEQDTQPVVECIHQLFECVFDPQDVFPPAAQVVIDNPAVQPQDSLYDVIFAYYNPHFYNQDEIEAIRLRDINKVVGANKNRHLLRFFEPLVVRAMHKYQISHDVSLQQSILSLFSLLGRFGVDFSRLDKENNFIHYVINQITHKSCYLPKPTLLLPHMFDFIATLFVLRRHLTEVLTAERVMMLCGYVFNSPTTDWNRDGALLPSLNLLIHYLFATSAEEESKWNSENLKELKEQFFARIVAKTNFTDAIPLLTRILVQMKNSRDAMVELDWKQYSQQIGNRILTLLSSSRERMKISSIEAVNNLYTVFNHVSISVVSPMLLLETLLSCTFSSNYEEDVSQTPRTSFTVVPAWLPGLVVLVRITSIVREETLISAAQQLLHKQKREALSPEFMIANFLLSALLSAAENILGNFTPPAAFPAELLSHLLHHCVVFFGGDSKNRRSRIVKSVKDVINSQLENDQNQLKSIIQRLDAIFRTNTAYPEHALVWFHILFLMNEPTLLTLSTSTSGSYQDSFMLKFQLESWTGISVKTAEFLTYCYAMLQSNDVAVEESLLKKLSDHIDDAVVKKFLSNLMQNDTNSNVAVKFIQEWISQKSLSISEKYEVLGWIDRLPSSQAFPALSLLVDFTSQPHAYVMNSILVKIANKILTFLKNSLSVEGHEQKIQGNLEEIYQKCARSEYSRKQPALLNTFQEILPVGIQVEKTEVQVESEQATALDLQTLIPSRFDTTDEKRFKNLDLILEIDPKLLPKIVGKNLVPFPELAEFLRCGTKFSEIQVEETRNFLEKYFSEQLEKMVQLSTPLSTSQWEWELGLIQATEALLTSPAYSPEISPEFQSILLKSACASLKSFDMLLDFNTAIPSDSISLIQFCTAILQKCDYPDLEKDPHWTTLLIHLRHLYISGVEGGYIRIASTVQLDSSPMGEMRQVLQFLLSQLKESRLGITLSSVESVHQAFSLFLKCLAKPNFPYLYPPFRLQDEVQVENSENHQVESPLMTLQWIIDQEFPEAVMRDIIKNIHMVGWQTSAQFSKLWELFVVCLKLKPGVEIDGMPTDHMEISETIQSLALAGATSLLLRAVFLDKRIGGKESGSLGPFIYYPREKELHFLTSEHGRKLVILQTMIDAAIYRSQYFNLTESDLVVADILDWESKEKHQDRKQSPFHVNAERFPSHSGPQRYYAGQVSIAELRQQVLQQRLWEDVNLSQLIGSLMIQCEIVMDRSNSQILLQKQVFKSLVLLSDAFSITQFNWMLDLFLRLYDSEAHDNFLLKQYLVLGICKCTAVLQLHKPVLWQTIARILKASIEGETCLQLAALNGILYLLEAQLSKVLST